MGDVKVNLKELEEFRDKVQTAADEAGRQAFIEACANQLAARLLAAVIKRTPVGDYSGEEYDCKQKIKTGDFHHKGHKDVKNGGELRKSWTVDKIEKSGSCYTVKIKTDKDYASYVEYGHRIRKKDGWGWEPGHLMLTFSEDEIRKAAPGILEKKLAAWLGEVFK